MKPTLILCLFLAACGGGGEGYQVAQGEPQPWEVSAGVCSFDNEAAEQEATRLGADCWRTLYVGNRGDWWPPSWPSTPSVWRAMGAK